MKRKIHREDIIKSGRDLMFTKGYNGTGIKDITDDVGIPKGSFYNHFSSKEAFGLEMVKEYSDNGVQMYRRRLLDTSKTPTERLHVFFDSMIDNYTENLDFKLGCIMSNFSAEMADVNPNFQEVLNNGFNNHQAILSECIREGQESGEFSSHMDADALGSFILNSWHGSLVRMKATGSAAPLIQCKEAVFQLITP